MAIQEVMTPEVEVPVLQREIEACGWLDVLVEFPGMDDTCHRGDGVAIS